MRRNFDLIITREVLTLNLMIPSKGFIAHRPIMIVIKLTT